MKPCLNGKLSSFLTFSHILSLHPPSFASASISLSTGLFSCYLSNFFLFVFSITVSLLLCFLISMARSFLFLSYFLPFSLFFLFLPLYLSICASLYLSFPHPTFLSISSLSICLLTSYPTTFLILFPSLPPSLPLFLSSSPLFFSFWFIDFPLRQIVENNRSLESNDKSFFFKWLF